jgi:flagellar biosynthetic protein FlhB
MAEEDDASKTEEPTGRKLAKAREEGQVAQSQEIKSWLILVGGAGMLIFMAPKMASDITAICRRFIVSSYAIPVDLEHLRLLLSNIALDVGIVLAPPFGMFVILAIIANVGQFGLLWSTKKVAPKPSKLNPISGIKRVASSQSVMEFIKGILKITLVTVVALSVTVPMLHDLEIMPSISTGAALDLIHEEAIMVALASAGVMTVIAALDYAYQRAMFMKQMRMSKTEVKDEHKQTDGDPQIKARIRQIRMDRARKRMMAAVPNADVIVTNPTHYAVALEYKMETMPAPKVIAKGQDFLALKIREIAAEHDITIVENPPLARALYSSVELDEEIPPEHFKAVAEVIGHVMRLKGKLPN